jgi:NitT/TauT family transport system substrate-binding protein
MRTIDECDNITDCLHQFKGQKIGTPSQGSIHDIILRHILKENSLGTDCVVNYAWADLIAEDVRNDELAGAVGTPPLAVMCQKWYGMQTILPPQSLWPFNPSYGIAVHRSMLEEETLLSAFLTLHENACNMIRLKPGHAAAVLAEEIQVVDAEFIQDVFAVSPRYCASLPDEYIKSTMKFVPVLQQMGHLRKALLSHQVFDCSFIDKTHPEPQHYYPQK